MKLRELDVLVGGMEVKFRYYKGCSWEPNTATLSYSKRDRAPNRRCTLRHNVRVGASRGCRDTQRG